MFHAEVRPARVLKQIIESLKEVVNECTFECTDSQMQVQAMDGGHVSLVSLELEADKFYNYRCERNLQLGVNIGSLSKMMRCSAPDDCVVLTADSSSDVLNLRLADINEERVTDFSMKLLEIDSEALGIPEQRYKAAVKIPSAEFAKICRDIAAFGETVTVEVTPNHVTFSASGDIGTGKVQLKASKYLDGHIKTEPGLDVKEERNGVQVKEEPETLAADGTRIKREGEKKRPVDEGVDEGADGEEPPKKAKKTTKGAASGSAAKQASKVKGGDRDGVNILCDEPVCLQFALRYLTMFSKAQAVSDTVSLKLGPNVPLQVEFEIQGQHDVDSDKDVATSHQLGYLRYYLAPKVSDGDDAQAGEDAYDE